MRLPSFGRNDAAGKGETEMGDADTYTMTKNGLELGLAAGVSKFWKDKDLN